MLRARASWPAWPTAGQSVRRIQAPTGEDALWHQTVSEVFSSPGTLLGAQRHARADRITSHSRHTDGRHHTEGDQVLLTHTNADRARGVTRGQQRSLAARLQAALVLTDSSMPGLTWTPMISQQSPSPSLQQLANQCAGLGFKPPPGTPRAGTKQSQWCFLQPHVVQGLSALSVMLDTTRRATRCCSHTPTDRARGVTVAVRASVRACRLRAAG